ncbi:SixA phosphatase family protein [Leekyejoonella antrihumi]|uniref:Histidine phosphatase family protein n=1 Tax=Leekyejoonella antrihumi TaxID=1660198 RepID=A0A563DSV0_9MICO|nr:histidine phosphatase family protein [Leekyejoonella antrihumi]TWP33305.1 histidine phosphatase family protein [Leekyejoonella antrihumi]
MSRATRRLVLVRHAKAQDPAGTADHERRLTAAGRSDARELGRWLKERKVVPGTVLCSTAVRTRETWANVSDAGTLGALIEHDARIYNAGVSTLLQVLQEVDADASTVLLVGHAPGVPALADVLSEGQPGTEELAAGYPTCTVSILRVGVPWADLAPGVASVEAVHTARHSEH